MARRRHETGLKKQQRIEREQRGLNARDASVEPDDRRPERVHREPVPPSATQMFENTAPPIMAPMPDK
jgi:hypothetical protein